ncbi:MAG: hypothetical protein MI743_10490 [Sneathiellales bacterium]|nr:hypothetical protein [Sneathiellales bacterium]
MQNKFKIVLSMVIAVTASACAGVDQDNARVLSSNANGSLVIATARDMPIIQSRLVKTSKGKRVDPDYVTCVAPSPDVASAVSSSFDAAAKLAGKLPNDIEPEAAFAISSAQTQGIAALGERIATIQLLRDGLYRACEAYANGAISKTAYAVMLSRYDDTMVTLMAMDLASGGFGRPLPVLTGKAKGEAKADEEGGEVTTESEADVNSGTPAASSTAANPKTDAQIAWVIHQMQRKYIENINSDALSTACIVALSDGDENSPLAKKCPNLLAQIEKHMNDILAIKLKNSQNGKSDLTPAEAALKSSLKVEAIKQ